MADYYTQLLDWRRLEASVRGLAKLPPDFYTTTQAYLADLRRTFETELRENPSGRKGELARQTHQRASQVARDTVEARMTKLLSAAFQASAGGSREVPNTLPEERTLFEGLLRLLRDHRAQAAPFLEPDAGSSPPSRVPATASSNFPSVPRTVEARSERAGQTMVFVRIVQEGRPIETGGETIDLRKEDVVSLPRPTAQILVDAKLSEWLRPAEPRSVT